MWYSRGISGAYALNREALFLRGLRRRRREREIRGCWIPSRICVSASAGVLVIGGYILQVQVQVVALAG